MSGITPLHQPSPEPPARTLPYCVELGDGSPLALARSGAVAYAAYYAAIREYLGQPIRLRCDGVVIASFGG